MSESEKNRYGIAKSGLRIRPHSGSFGLSERFRVKRDQKLNQSSDLIRETKNQISIDKEFVGLSCTGYTREDNFE